MNLEQDAAQETVILSDKEIFTKIWTSPRKVFKYLNENEYDKFIYVLLPLAGISNAFFRAATKNAGDVMPLLVIIFLCIFLGGLVGWFSLFIYSALMNWTGKWLNGQGDTNSLLRMTAHALFPSILALILFIPQIIYFGNGIFQSEIDVSTNGIMSAGIYYSTAILEIILGCWTLVLIIVGISEVQKLSIGKSILNMVLPGLIVIIPVGMIAYTLGDLFG